MTGWLTLDQAAERVQLSTFALRRAISRGELRAVKACRRIRISEADLAVWLARCEIAPKSCAPATPGVVPMPVLRARIAEGSWQAKMRGS